MQKDIQLEIGFGPLVPKIATQLKKQKFKFNKSDVAYFEKLRESIIYLTFAQLISNSAKEKAYQKLFKKIRSHIIKKNKLKLDGKMIVGKIIASTI